MIEDEKEMREAMRRADDQLREIVKTATADIKSEIEAGRMLERCHVAASNAREALRPFVPRNQKLDR